LKMGPKMCTEVSKTIANLCRVTSQNSKSLYLKIHWCFQNLLSQTSTAHVKQFLLCAFI
jgi:hypothetical protein